MALHGAFHNRIGWNCYCFVPNGKCILYTFIYVPYILSHMKIGEQRAEHFNQRIIFFLDWLAFFGSPESKLFVHCGLGWPLLIIYLCSICSVMVFFLSFSGLFLGMVKMRYYALSERNLMLHWGI